MGQILALTLLCLCFTICQSAQFNNQWDFSHHSHHGGFSQFGQQNFQQPEDRMKFDVLKHQPCRSNSVSNFHPHYNRVMNWTEKIRFPDSSHSNLREDPSTPGCYFIRGSVHVKDRIKNQAQAFVAVRYRVEANEAPEPCRGYDANGCGGWGSCLYCYACQTLQASQRTLQAVTLTKGGRTINCYDDLMPGYHDDVELRFCMPTKSEFLQIQGWTEEMWSSYVGGRQDGRPIGIFLTITMFDEPQNYDLSRQRQEEAYYRQTTGYPYGQKLPFQVQKNFPFYNKVVKHNSGFIGCHRIYGNLFLQ